jgi:cholesterol 7-dehydrogenase
MWPLLQSYPLIIAFLFGVLFYKYFLLRKEDESSVSRRASRKALESKKRKDMYPKSYPNSWFKLMNSDDLKIGETKYIEALGRDYAVFRGHDGVVGVLDAFCPHNGANLTVGGKVVGNCIQCPFHLWEFDTNGQCTKIPYYEKAEVPKQIRTTAYPSMEYYGSILIYNDSQNRLPTYDPPVIPNFSSNFMYRGRYSKTISMHLVEFAENSADFQHFQPLHGRMEIPFLGIPIPFITIRHNADWKVEEDKSNSHMAYFYDNAQLLFRGKPIPNSSANAKISFVGAGGLVIFEFFTPMGKIVLFQSHLPLEPLVTKVDFLWFAEKQMWCIHSNFFSCSFSLRFFPFFFYPPCI